MVQRPLVTLSYAQSIDGSIAARRGEPLALSGDESLKMTHQLRAEHDAILIGVGTALADDPALTVRLVKGKNPQPIVLDSGLRISAESTLVKNGAWLIATARASQQREQTLTAAGATVYRLRESRTGRIALPDLMSWLNRQGVRTLMVEGGAEIIESFLMAQLVDKVVITVVPLMIGGLKPIAQPLPATQLRNVQIAQLGADTIIRGDL